MSRRSVRRARLLALALSLAAVLGGCMPAGATVQGQEISRLYDVFLVGGMIVAAIVWSLVTWSVIRYRRREGRTASQIEGNLTIEIIWTVIPLATVLALFALTVITLGSLDAVEPGGVNIRVIAFRWQWQVVYTDAGVTDIGTNANPLQLVLPVNTPIHVTLESLDVNHAMYLPAFLFKRDAIPGTPTSFDIRITQQGTYPGACAEFCGLGHDDMLFSVRAVDPATYRAWIASRAATPGSSSSPSPGASATAGSSASPSASAAPSSSGASTSPVPSSSGSTSSAGPSPSPSGSAP